MEFNREEDDFSEKILGETENEIQRTMHYHSSGHGSSSSDFFDGKTEAKFKKLELVSKNNKISCPHCIRKFSSAQALGGHIRTHNEPEPDYSVAEVFPNTIQKEKSDNTCCICKDSFQSICSLRRRMIKNHPDTDRKGIRPPNSDETAESTTQLKQQEPVTGKRDRKATIKENFGINRAPEKKRKLQDSQVGNQTQFPLTEIEQAAATLLSLKRGSDLGKYLPEEVEIIEEEHNIHKVDNGSTNGDSQTNSF